MAVEMFPLFIFPLLLPLLFPLFIFPLLDLWMAVEMGGMGKYETLKNFEDPLIEPHTILMFQRIKQIQKIGIHHPLCKMRHSN